ncbi:hypothetical protein Tdes44962_MAKER07211 [Teratosphaeria destructans]|uniref:Uncharacterized protein n=1 Tax=Teratosphaeria destructans TaxID=418781 RepID=A0A9W7T077_9PEZI|nr:hypothetical protein Tdes44962_MAKER07211 [Teratosphaeria destructans]
MGSQDVSCGLEIQIILANVDAFDPRCEGDIHAVIDEKWHAGRLGDSMQCFGYADEVSRVRGFVSQLDNSDTCDGG